MCLPALKDILLERREVQIMKIMDCYAVVVPVMLWRSTVISVTMKQFN